MAKITINNQEIETQEGKPLIEICDDHNIEIPRFCYHKKLEIAGNCRMCLVELEGSNKLVASCATNAKDGMVVKTTSKKVEEAQKGVLELLLINHPLDCPVCDQGGECDLQDQAYKYGKGLGNYHFPRRAVTQKDFGPFIKTYMTRCIHCTRCIRFAEDVAGIEDLGAINRGEDMEIISYVQEIAKSKLSGNIIDLCPVGALTSKPYAFQARHWDLNQTESIDILDSFGSNITIYSKNFEIMRILPRQNEKINEEWISDKARFAYDGLKYQRLDKAYIRKNGKLEEVKFEIALNETIKKLQEYKGEEIAAISGLLSDCESIFLLKEIMQKLGSNNLSMVKGNYNIDMLARENYLFNSKIHDIKKADLIILIGTDISNDMPLLAAKIKQAYRENNNIKIYNIGNIKEQIFPIKNLGNNLQILESFIDNNSHIGKIISKSINPMIIVGEDIINREDAKPIISKIHNVIFKYKQFLQPHWNGFNILYYNTGTINALELDFYKTKLNTIYKDVTNNKIKLIYLHGADEINQAILKNTFIIYQGHHGDKGAEIADIILPSTSYAEKDASYINLNGTLQKSYRAIESIGDAKTDIDIFLTILNKIFKIAIHKEDLEEEIHKFIKSKNQKIIQSFSKEKIKDNLVKIEDNNFFMSDIISKNSPNMLKAYKIQIEA